MCGSGFTGICLSPNSSSCVLKIYSRFCFICITKALKIRRKDAQGLAAGPRWMYPPVAPFRAFVLSCSPWSSRMTPESFALSSAVAISYIPFWLLPLRLYVNSLYMGQSPKMQGGARMETLPDIPASISFPPAMALLIPRQTVLRQMSSRPPFTSFLYWVHIIPHFFFIFLCFPESDSRHKPGNKSSI